MERVKLSPRFNYVTAIAIGLASLSSSSADDGRPAAGTAGNELLQPARQKSTDAKTAHQVTYKLSGGSDKWDSDPRDRIVHAMDEAVAIYNKNGDF